MTLCWLFSFGMFYVCGMWLDFLWSARILLYACVLGLFYYSFRILGVAKWIIFCGIPTRCLFSRSICIVSSSLELLRFFVHFASWICQLWIVVVCYFVFRSCFMQFLWLHFSASDGRLCLVVFAVFILYMIGRSRYVPSWIFLADK